MLAWPPGQLMPPGKQGVSRSSFTGGIGVCTHCSQLHPQLHTDPDYCLLILTSLFALSTIWRASSSSFLIACSTRVEHKTIMTTPS